MLIPLVLAVLQVAGGPSPAAQPPVWPATSWQFRRAMEPGYIQLRYASGNTFRVENTLPFAVQVTWDVIGTRDSGSLVLPATNEQVRVSTAYFTTRKHGPVRLYFQGLNIQSAANGNKPPSPWPLLGTRLPPFDTTLVVVNPEDGKEFFRTRIGVRFEREATDSIIRVLVGRYGLTMVGLQWSNMFIVAIQDPGIAWTHLLAFRQRLEADPFIAGTRLINHPLPPLPPGRTTRRVGLGWSRPPIPPARGLAGLTDTSIVVPLPGAPVYRNIFAVRFDDSTSGSTVRDVLRVSRGEIISGNPEAGEYIVRFADPGASYDAVMSLQRWIAGYPGVGHVTPILLRVGAPLPPNPADSARALRWVEGNTFAVCNTLPTEDRMEWEVYATTETGALVLPPRTVGKSCTESVFTTRNRGTVRLFRDGGILQVEANGSPPPGLAERRHGTPAASREVPGGPRGFDAGRDHRGGHRVVCVPERLPDPVSGIGQRNRRPRPADRASGRHHRRFQPAGTWCASRTRASGSVPWIPCARPFSRAGSCRRSNSCRCLPSATGFGADSGVGRSPVRLPAKVGRALHGARTRVSDSEHTPASSGLRVPRRQQCMSRRSSRAAGSIIDGCSRSPSCRRPPGPRFDSS